MSGWKKLAAASAGGAGGLDITDVFSTYLYTGNATERDITTGIDLAGEDGLLWVKNRSSTSDHSLFSPLLGARKSLNSNSTQSAYASTSPSPADKDLKSFNSDGFSIFAAGYNANLNVNGFEYVAWSFRKAPKFFDVVTYSGTGNAGLTINHNLGSVPGCIIIKSYDHAKDWAVYHRGVDATNPEDYALVLQKTDAREDNVAWFNDTAPTATQFTVGNKLDINTSGKNYIAYIFAHNDGDGEFGPDGSDIIKCGSYVGNGSTDGPEIDLGFEPQWLMYKNTNGTDNWEIVDTMRGMPADGNTMRILKANSSAAESSDNAVGPNATGFKVTNPGGSNNDNGSTYIYMAIRRGPLAAPTAGTEVFDVKTRTANEPHFKSDFDRVDFALYKSNISGTGDLYAAPRLISNKILITNSTSAEINGGTGFVMDFSGGWYGNSSASSTSYSWMWKRAPSYFDVVCWNTENTANRRLKHNLGVAPEMVWIKNRATEQWYVYQSDLGSNIQLRLDTNDDVVTTSALWPSPSATEFGIRENAIWNTGTSLVGFFFATLAGISKVGSYTGNGSSQTIDCGFTSGSRFILIKRTDANGNWVFFDSLRGIIAGNSPSLFLNDTEGQRTSEDIIDPASSGFIVNQETQQNLNVNGSNYIFYAIA